MADISAIFTVADARAFDKLQLGNQTTYPDALIEAAEASIRAEFERIIGVALIPTTTKEVLDGSGTPELRLRHHNPFSEINPRPVEVSECVIRYTDGTVYETFDAADLADLACYHTGKIVRRQRGLFIAGNQNVTVTYKHGFSAVQGDIRRAALIECVRRLVPKNVPFEGETGDEHGIHWSQVRDPGRGRWFGVPEVDGVLNAYRSRECLPVIG